MNPLTHLDESGAAHMVDVGDKASTQREAIAGGRIRMQPQTLEILKEGASKKGDVIATARIAGIMASKKTPELIPLCHTVMISKASVDFTYDDALPGVAVVAKVRCAGQTGVEMEALTAVSVACLTIYDMLKAVDKGMIIQDIRLLEKHGGKSGSWVAETR